MTEVVVNEAGIKDVSGGASGIGKALVELLHRKGASVVFGDLQTAAGDKLAAELGPNVDFLKTNVLVWKELLALFSFTQAKYGRVDLVFANAGVPETQNAFEDVYDENGDLVEPTMTVIDVNLKSVALTAKLAMSYFQKNSPPGGGLVLTCSTSGYNERPNLPLYSAAKHGVAGLMRALRHEAPKQGVNVALIAPGGTETGMLDENIRNTFRSLGIPLQSPEYVATAALWLASDPAQNGKGLTLIGSVATEVEGPLLETQPTWYGQYNLDMAAKAANVNYVRK
ncbi:hypothetical protein LTR20_006670 [Exophiala xenobiotica]|nr:hypothetical protein LTR90_007234 [Exophiala xenobiotica]KAK5461746.1 hypothetical protein LTR20_006670 [Exophiala xenobiotica]KAK5482430.1 hypothetical protein LTR26_006764 [Exophiala xenobiotica]KAK5507137.1 hypothetical protein LTR21_009348 [Exophiala xenobiotica]